MNLRSSFAWVRVAGLASVLGLVACDSGDSKKAEPVKPDVPAKTEPAKTEPVKTEPPAPEPPKVDPPADVKAADTAAAPADPAAAPDAKAADTAGDTAGAAAKPEDTKPAEDTKAKTEPKETKKPAAEKAPAIDGKPLYMSKCKVCHAESGEGTAAMKKNNIPDMRDKGWQGKHSKAAVVKAIADGVPGTKMQAFKAKLKPEEIDAVAAYVKKLK